VLPFDAIVTGLRRVKRATPIRGMARAVRASCPTANHEHGDRSGGLLVSERQTDGAVLLCCPAGCPADEIVGALGLNMCDLYPRDLDPGEHGRKGTRSPFPAGEILRAVSHEVLVASVIAADFACNGEISPVDHERLILAAARITAGASIARGARHG
jgi:hypothetical protein